MNAESARSLGSSQFKDVVLPVELSDASKIVVMIHGLFD